MALVHDVAESIVGDITPHCGISKSEKEQLEMEAMKKLRTMLEDYPEASEEMMQLWEEYCAAETAEAQFVKDLDKLEMILQADEYEETQDVDLQQFFDNTKDVFRTETGQMLSDQVRSDRQKRKQRKEPIS